MTRKSDTRPKSDIVWMGLSLHDLSRQQLLNALTQNVRKIDREEMRRSGYDFGPSVEVVGQILFVGNLHQDELSDRQLQLALQRMLRGISIWEKSHWPESNAKARVAQIVAGPSIKVRHRYIAPWGRMVAAWIMVLAMAAIITMVLQTKPQLGWIEWVLKFGMFVLAFDAIRLTLQCVKYRTRKSK